MKLLFITLLISGIAFGQKKDSLPPKPDSVQIIVNEIAQFAYDKILAKDYDVLRNVLSAYLQQKEFTKPKKK